MGIDANIALGVKPLQLPNPMELQKNALAIQGAQQQIQTNALAQASAQRDFDNSQAVQAQFQNPDFQSMPIEQQAPALMAAGGAAAAPIVKNMLEARTAAMDYKTKVQTQNTIHATVAAQALGSTDNAQDASAQLDAAVSNGILDPTTAANMKAELPADPAQFATFKQEKLSQILPPLNQYQAAQPDVQMVDGSTGKVAYNTKPSAGPLGPIPGSPIVPAPPKDYQTDDGVLRVNPDGTTTMLATPQQLTSGQTPPVPVPPPPVPAPPSAGASPPTAPPLVPPGGFQRQSPTSPPFIPPANAAPTNALSPTAGQPTDQQLIAGQSPALQAIYQQSNPQQQSALANTIRATLANKQADFSETAPNRNLITDPTLASSPSPATAQTGSGASSATGPVPVAELTAKTPPTVIGASLATQSTNTPINSGPGAGGKDFYTPELAKNFATYSEGLNKTVQTGQQLMPVISQFAIAMQNFKTGPGANTKLGLANALAALPGVGPDNALVKQIANGSLTDAALIEKEAATMSLDVAKTAMGDAGRVTQFDFRIFHDVNANVQTPPQTVYRIFNQMGQQFAQKEDEQISLNSYLQNGGNPAQWNAAWNGYLSNSGRIQVMGSNNQLQNMPNTTGAGPARVTNDADFNALPSGTDFIAPDGSHRRKP